AEVLGLSDLHVVDEIAIPDGLEEGIGKAEVQEILYSLLTEVVIDAIHRRFREDLVQDLVKALSRGEVTAKRFLQHDPSVMRASCLPQSPHDRCEHTGRHREVMERAVGPVQCLFKMVVGCEVLVVAIYVLQQSA